MRTKRIIILLLACLALPTWAAARPLQGDPQTRARLRENINTLRLLRMTEALDLTEAQTARLFPVLNRIEKEKAELQRRMGIEIRDLRAALDKSPVQDADILALVRRVKEIRQSVQQKDEELEALLDENLTPVQKGRYLLFLVDFARGLGEKLNRARQIRGKN
jgi:Spy/CpxP family protein refolding chaperone